MWRDLGALPAGEEGSAEVARSTRDEDVVKHSKFWEQEVPSGRFLMYTIID
jgi:hypothetical protein